MAHGPIPDSDPLERLEVENDFQKKANRLVHGVSFETVTGLRVDPATVKPAWGDDPDPPSAVDRSRYMRASSIKRLR